MSGEEALHSSLEQQLEAERALRLQLELRLQQKEDELQSVSGKLEAFRVERDRKTSHYRERLAVISDRMLSLLENLEYAVVMDNGDGHILFANQLFCDCFNIPAEASRLNHSRFNIIGHCSSFFEDPSLFTTRVKIIESKQSKVLNEELQLKDGRILSRNYIPIRSRGRYRGHLWMFSDITEQRKTEVRLNEQQAFYEELLNNMPASVLVTDTSYRYLYINPSAVKDHAIRQWMIGKNNEEVGTEIGTPPEITERRRRIFDSVMATAQSIEWEEKIPNSDGVMEYVLRKTFPILGADGNPELVASYGINITERKQFEEQIRLSEKRYRDLFNYSQALICTHDMSGKILAVNPEICKILGYAEEELIGQNIGSFVSAEQQAQFSSVYLADIRTKNPVNGVFSALNKKGEKIYLLYQNYRMDELDSEPYVIGFSQDITRRIRIEKELMLAKQLTENAARAKEAFLAHMSHEIRTPLNGVLGIASLLGKTKLEEQQRNYLQLIRESANNLLVIVNDVLDLEKIIAGKLQLEKIPFKIVDKVAITIQSFIYKAEEKELGLVFQNFIPADMVVMGDPYRLSQVMNNILANALKFTEVGYITIATRIAKRTESLVIIELAVRDTGIGISEDRIKNIFEPFMQADSSISRKYGGTGLGLTICKNLIELQNGELLVQSEEAKGSTFIIRIPYTLGAKVEVETEELPEVDFKSLGMKKVLVAEDVELNQFLAKHILESWGFEVALAGNGYEALQLLQHQNFDCILMDVQMPEMDGIEATQRIRKLADAKKAAVPIIALTANALKGDSEKYIAAGMNDYLAKPFDETNLFLVISKNLENINLHHTMTNEINNSNGQKETVTGKLYDLSMVESVSGGDHAFIKKMIALFIETVPQNVNELTGSFRSGNWEQVGKMAHKLKSTVDSMGIQAIKADIRTIEAHAKERKSLDELPALIEKVNTTIDQCIGQLQVELESL